MSTFALPSQVRPACPRKKPLSKRMEVGITVVLVVVGIVLALLSLSFLFYANAQATQDYHLRVLQEKRSQLIAQNEVLGMQIANSQSLQALATNEQIQQMVPAQNLLYISGVTAVAQK